MSSPVREVLAYFGIEVDTEEMKKADHEVEGFIEKVKGIGEAIVVAFAVEKVKEFVFGMAEMAEKLELQAISLGTSTGALQEWQFAASMVGVGADQLAGAMMRLEKASGGGGKGAGKGLQTLGINAMDAAGKTKPVTELMDEVADKIQKIEDPAKRTQAAMQIFGKTGAKLIPLLEQGSKGIKKFRDEVKELGGGMSEDFIKKSKEMLQNSKRLNLAWQSFKVTVVGELLPPITELIMWLVKGSVWLMKLAKSSNILTTAFVVLGVGAVTALSSMIGPLGAILAELAPVIIAFLLLEDAITFLTGGDSELGRAIDQIFGPGAGDKVRNWITHAIQDFEDLVGAITGGSSDASERWREDWDVFQKKLISDFGDIGRIAIWLMKLMTGGFGGTWDQITALWGVASAVLSNGWIAFARGWKSAIWTVQDAFADFVNGLLEGSMLVLKGVRAAASAVGKTELVTSIDKALDGSEKHMMMNRHSEEGNNELDTQKADNTARMLAYGDVLAGVKSHSTESDREERDNPARSMKKFDIHINVPHGTPHGVAVAAGEASEEGVNRANAAALIPGDG